MQKLLTFFQQKFLAYMPYLMIKVLMIVNDTLTNVNNRAQFFLIKNKTSYLELWYSIEKLLGICK